MTVLVDPAYPSIPLPFPLMRCMTVSTYTFLRACLLDERNQLLLNIWMMQVLVQLKHYIAH